MSEKTISFDLSLRSLDAAISEIEKMADGIDDALLGTAESLTEFGEGAADYHFAEAASVLGGPGRPIEFYADFNEEERTGYISALGEEAAYYEYGTGIVGMHSPHPGIKSGESTPPVMVYKNRTYTRYDTYEHGLEGWNYRDPDTGETVHTAGMVGMAFMYNTYKELCELAPAQMKQEMEKRGVMT